jgi:hypothetical protein
VASRTRLALTAGALAALMPLTACQPADTHGTVTARIHHGKWRYLAVRQPDGRTVKFRVGLFSSEWRHCHVGEPYPECE